MIVAYLLMAAMLVASIVFLYLVVIRSVGQLTNVYQQDFVKVRRAEIAQEEEMGRLTASESLQLLQDLDQETNSQNIRQPRSFRSDIPLARWVMLGAVVTTVLGSVSLYQQIGYSTEVVFTQDLQTQKLTSQKVTDFLQYRSKRYDRAEDWYYLAMDHMSAEKYQEAVVVFEQALEKISPTAKNYVTLLVEYAQAIFYANGNQSSPKMLAVVNAILQQEPTQTAALDLKGVAEFSQKNYLGAVLTWQEAIRYSTRSAERLALLSAIAKARQAGDIDYQQVAPIITHQLTVKIEWDTNAWQWRPDDVLLVYALANGQKMPVAIQRVFPEDLGQPILLSNLDALMPTATLAQIESVDLVVKLSNINDNDLTKGQIIGIKHGLLTNSKEIFVIKVAL